MTVELSLDDAAWMLVFADALLQTGATQEQAKAIMLACLEKKQGMKDEYNLVVVKKARYFGAPAAVVLAVDGAAVYRSLTDAGMTPEQIIQFAEQMKQGEN